MNRHFWIMTGGQAISNLGSSFGQIAQAWLVYELTGSKLAMGTIFLLGLIPETILRLLGAPLVDKVNRVHLLRRMESLQTVIYALPPLLAATGYLQLWHLYVLAVLAGLARALYVPTYFAILPSVVSKEQLVRANSISQTILNGVYLAGPALAGILVNWAGAIPALAIDGVSYAASALSLFLIPTSLGRVESKPTSGGGYFAKLSEGITFYRQTPALFLVMLVVAAANFGTTPVFNMLVPFVREQLGAGAQAVGFVTAAFPTGVMLGGLLINWLGEPKSRRLGMTLSISLSGTLIMAMGLLGSGQILLAILLWFASGVTIGYFNPMNAALHQRMVPDELRGRVQAVRLTIGWGINPIAAFLGSLVAEQAGLPTMMVVVGLVSFLVPLLVLSSRSLRGIEDRPATCPESLSAPTPAA
jgi:MFS family permease